MKIRLDRKTAGTLALVSLIAAAPAPAQDVLDEIVVTALRREQNLQDVAASITALSGDDIRELGIGRAQDIAAVTPGLYAPGSQGDTNPLYTIRGIGLNDVFSNNNPTVGLYVDDVIQPYTPMMGFQVFDMQRIEVLKGPQGTLYGRNSTGGAINFITRKPGDDPNGYVRGGYGNYGRFEAEGALGGPLADGWGGRIAFSTLQQSDGWMHNAFNGEDVGERDKTAVRAMLEWQPSDTFDGRLTATWGSEDSDSSLREHVGFLDGAFSPTLCQAALEGRRDEGPCVSFLGYFDPTDDRYTVENSSVLGQRNDTDAYGANLTLNWQLGEMTLSSITGYSSFERSYAEDSDGTALIMLDSEFTDDIEAVSEELRLAGEMENGGSWVVGAFFSDDEIVGGIFQALDEHIFLTRVDTTWTQESASQAVFGHVDYPLAGELSFVGGLRFTHETKDFRYDSFDLDPFGTTQNLPTPVAGIVDDISNDEVSGQVGLQYRFSDRVMTYASYSRGFKSGGYKAAIAFNPDELVPFDEEILNAFEVGLKSSLAGDTVRFNGAVYHYDWEDFQAFVTEVRSGINVIVLDNAGDATVYGVEADLLWQPVSELDVRLAANWMETEIDRFESIPGTADATGNRLANSPELMLNGRLRYEFPLGDSGLMGYALTDAVYRDKIYYSLSNNGQNSQPSYWLWNARLAMTGRDESWEVGLWGRNLTDEFYITQSYDNTGGIFPSQNFVGEPRTYGIDFQYRFF